MIVGQVSTKLRESQCREAWKGPTYLFSFFFCFFFVFCQTIRFIHVHGGWEGHCPEEGVSQQTVLCISRSWYLDSVRAGGAGWPLLSPKHAGSLGGRSFRCVALPPPASALPPTQGDAVYMWQELRENGWVGGRLSKGY